MVCGGVFGICGVFGGSGGLGVGTLGTSAGFVSNSTSGSKLIGLKLGRPESQIVIFPFGSSVGNVDDVESRAPTHPGTLTIGRPISIVTGA